LKDNLTIGECLIHLDFAENYSFVIQEEVQSYHWTNAQATIHPLCIYNRDAGKLMMKTYCIISDYLNHDATSVNVFLSEVITDLKRHVSELRKIYYLSDGGPAHYKNRFNFANLSSLHIFDFVVDGEWRFLLQVARAKGRALSRLRFRAKTPKPNRITIGLRNFQPVV
jgi:hypothetical protein